MTPLTLRQKLVLPAVLAGLAAPALGLFVANRVLGDYRGLMPGERLPEARLRSSDGTVINTQEWRGRSTLLVLFRSGCPACRTEIETLAAIAPRLPDLRIALLSTDGTVPESVPLAVMVDATGSLLRRTQRLAVPALYWVDAGGTVRFARIGALPEAVELELLRRLGAKWKDGPRSEVGRTTTGVRRSREEGGGQGRKRCLSLEAGIDIAISEARVRDQRILSAPRTSDLGPRTISSGPDPCD